MKNDYLIVGAGLFGSVVARELTDLGCKCLVIDKRPHIGGNCYTDEVEGVIVHKYGPHIFHTDSKRIWEYVNKFSDFNHFVNRPKVNYKGKIYSFPINLMTLYQLWGVKTPEEAISRLEQERIPISDPKNLEEWCLSQVGEEIYNIFIKGYTQKQWDRDPKELPSFIIKRLPIRLTFNDNYFTHKYQGIPIGGYTEIFKKLLDGIELKLDVDYFKDKKHWDSLARKVIFTGRIDQYYNYKFGDLEYRTLDFVEKVIDKRDFQGNAIMNYTEKDIQHTRIIEHKHFHFGKQKNTVITYEYPGIWNKNKTPYLPVNDSKNNKIYKQYRDLASNDSVIFGGRLAEYKYYDMHQVIGSALKMVSEEVW